MTAILARARADLRKRWRQWLAVGMLVGVLAGAVMAVVAGARRTDSSYQRLVRWSGTPDVLLFAPPGESDTFASFSSADVAKMPGVVGTSTGAGFSVVRPPEVALDAPERTGTGLGRRKLLAGRNPCRDDRVDEVTISFVLARARHLHVGDHLDIDLGSMGADEGGVNGRGLPGTTTLVPVRLHVVGIDAFPTEFPPQSGTGVQTAWVSPAFYRAHVDTILNYGVVAVWLRHHDADVPAFKDGLGQLSAGKAVEAFPLSDQSVNTQHSIHLQAVALEVLAALLAVTALLIVAQVLTRLNFLEADDFPALRAMGMRRWQLVCVATTRAVVIGVVGAVVAIAVTVGASPLLPVGLARTAEPHPGLRVDAAVVGIGAFATVGVVLFTTALAALWALRTASALSQRARTGAAAPSAIADAVGRMGAPITLTTGLRLALEPGKGRTAVPVRTTMTGAVVGVAALAMAIAFTASLGHLLATPPLYGVTWDARINALVADDVTSALPVLTADPRIADVSAGYAGFPLAIGRTRVDGMAMTPNQGTSLMPRPLAGRLPEAPDEIMLGPRTEQTLHAHLGSTVRATLADTGRSVTYRVVGEGVFPALSDAMGLGKGAAITIDGLKQALGPGVPPPPIDTGLVRFRPGVDPAHAIADINRRLSPIGDGLTPPDKPADLLNFGQVQHLPLVLGSLLGGLAIATIAHLLTTSIRRRRRDLAILKSLGFESHHVRAAIAWQATTLALAAAVIGIPVGVIAAHWLWIEFAHGLGIAPVTALHTTAFLALAGGAVIVANVVALVPGALAARVAPATVLHTE